MLTHCIQKHKACGAQTTKNKEKTKKLTATHPLHMHTPKKDQAKEQDQKEWTKLPDQVTRGQPLHEKARIPSYSVRNTIGINHISRTYSGGKHG